jgi:hypothetical protein
MVNTLFPESIESIKNPEIEDIPIKEKKQKEKKDSDTESISSIQSYEIKKKNIEN